MPSVLESGKLRARISRELAKPLHQLQHRRIVLIVCRRSREYRPLVMLRDEVDSVDIRPASQQNQRLDVWMALGEFDRITDAATAATYGNACFINAGLADEELICRFKISGPFLVQLLHPFRRPTFKPRPAAFSKSPVVDREGIDSPHAQSHSDWLPRFARGIAHVQQNHSGTRFPCREESSP